MSSDIFTMRFKQDVSDGFGFSFSILLSAATTLCQVLGPAETLGMVSLMLLIIQMTYETDGLLVMKGGCCHFLTSYHASVKRKGGGPTTLFPGWTIFNISLRVQLKERVWAEWVEHILHVRKQAATLDEAAQQAGELTGIGQWKVGHAAARKKISEVTVQRMCLRNKLPRFRKYRK